VIYVIDVRKYAKLAALKMYLFFFFMLQADWSMELSIDVFLPSQ